MDTDRSEYGCLEHSCLLHKGGVEFSVTQLKGLVPKEIC
jgi:hypothetical protein